MANKKLTDLNDLPSPAGADILAIVDDIAGTPTTKKVTATNLMSLAPVQSVAGRTGTVTLSNTDVSGLGTAATQDVGTSNGNVVQLDSTGLPVVDGSQLTGIVVTDESLRGTANPHIGAFPNQSFLVVDNPSKSVMLGSDADGKLYIFNSSGKSAISTGISAVEDSAEPDIEITTTSGTYSLITGDSDTLGANGLPIRQGFNAPDIGANPAPLLISGGTIS